MSRRGLRRLRGTADRHTGRRSDQLLTAAREARRLLFSGTQRRLEAPFRYLYDAIALRRGFGELAGVRCTLSIGEPPAGWRADPRLVGGGIVMVHWIPPTRLRRLAGVGGRPHLRRRARRGRAVHRRPMGADRGPGGEHRHRSPADPVRPDGGFDLSSAGPCAAASTNASRYATGEAPAFPLTRDQTERSATPGVVTHQRADGEVMTMPHGTGTVRLDGARLDGAAMTAGPLADFLALCAAGAGAPPLPSPHPCEGHEAVQTWQLIRAIRRHATWQEDVIR